MPKQFSIIEFEAFYRYISKNSKFHLSQLSNIANIFKLIDLSIYYRVKNLEIICSKFILSQIKFDNVFEYLKYSYYEIERQKFDNNSIYYEIFSGVINFFSKNFEILISQRKRELLELKNELFEFIIEKCVEYQDNFLKLNFENLIELLMKRNNFVSIFELLNNEIKRRIENAIENIKSNVNFNQIIIPSPYYKKEPLFQLNVSKQIGFEIATEMLSSSKAQIYLKLIKFGQKKFSKNNNLKKGIISNEYRNYRSVSPKESNRNNNNNNPFYHKPFGNKKYSNPGLLKGVKNSSKNHLKKGQMKNQGFHHSKSNSLINFSIQRSQNDYLNSPSQSKYQQKNSVLVTEESSKMTEDSDIIELDLNSSSAFIHSLVIFFNLGLEDTDGKVEFQLLTGNEKVVIKEIGIDRKIKKFESRIFIQYNYIISLILSYIFQNIESMPLFSDKNISILPYFIIKFLLARLNNYYQKNAKTKNKRLNSILFQILSNWLSNNNNIIIDNEKKIALLNLIDWNKCSLEEFMRCTDISKDQYVLEYLSSILEKRNFKSYKKQNSGNVEIFNFGSSIKKQIDSKSEDLSVK